MNEAIFTVNTKKMRSSLSKALKECETGCYIILKDDTVKIVPRSEWICDEYEIPAHIETNYPLRVNVLLISIEDVKELLSFLKQIKEKYVTCKAVFDEDTGFIEVENQQIFAYHL